MGYWVLMFAATHIPKLPTDRIPVPHGDKLLHILLYFGLTLLGGCARWSENRRMPTGSLLGWAVVFSTYGVIDEVLQPFVGRSASVFDWLADLLGVSLATILLVNRSLRRVG